MEIDFETMKKAVEIVEDWESHDAEEPHKDGATYLVQALFDLFQKAVNHPRGIG